MIRIKKLDETFIEVVTEEKAILKEIAEHLSFYAPGYQGDYQFKMGWWNGKKSLFNTMSHTLYFGLVPKLMKFLHASGYEFELDEEISSHPFSLIEAQEFVKSLNLPFEPRDYQMRYFVKSVRERRLVCVSPTASGKSLIVYLLYRYFGEKTLLVVPTLSLVHQMKKDFESYGMENSDELINTIAGGIVNKSKKPLTIANWQAIARQPAEFFQEFQVILGDEAHTWKAESLISIMRKASKAHVKIGFTGSITGEEYSDSTIEGLFGPLYRVITTRDMIERGFASELLIKCIVLDHKNNPYREMFLARPEYTDEIEFINNLEKRNKFISNLALSLEGNVFVMFKNLDQGHKLFDLISEKADCTVHYVDGMTSVEERESIRLGVEKSERSITVCSTVFATGINITSINNIIFASPSKSRVRILQSIGRGLRKNENKYNLTLFDIADDICRGKMNYTLEHFRQRLKLYDEEEFTYKKYRVVI